MHVSLSFSSFPIFSNFCIQFCISLLPSHLISILSPPHSLFLLPARNKHKRLDLPPLTDPVKDQFPCSMCLSTGSFGSPPCWRKGTVAENVKHIPSSSSSQGCRDSLAAEPAGARGESWDGPHLACYCWGLTPGTPPGAVVQPHRKSRAGADLPACSFPPLHGRLLTEAQGWGKTCSIYTRYMTHLTIFYLGFFFFLFFFLFCFFFFKSSLLTSGIFLRFQTLYRS